MAKDKLTGRQNPSWNVGRETKRNGEEELFKDGEMN